MKDTDFLSVGKYIFLPTRKNYKVCLNVSNREVTVNSLRLYNPFSNKAILLKGIVLFFFQHFNFIFRNINHLNIAHNSAFIDSVEKKMGSQFHSSVYFSTERDKAIVQLQSSEGFLGYLKFPLNDLGIKRIQNELKGIKILSNHRIGVPKIVYENTSGYKYIVLEEIKGSVGCHDLSIIHKYLNKMKKNNRFRLVDHPRVLALYKGLNNLGRGELMARLDRLCVKSKEIYQEVFEHGDFAPWNIISNNGRILAFDLEYFVESGLEHMDLFKYHFQVQSLLNGLTGVELIKQIESKIKLKEFNILLQIFLIDEILKKLEISKSIEFENDLLKLVKDE